MNFRIVLLSGLVLFSAASAFASLQKIGQKTGEKIGDSAAERADFIILDEKAWTLAGESDGIRVFKQEKENDPIVGLRGQGIIDAPIAKVAQVIFDNSRAPEWIDSLADTRILKKITAYERIEYDHISTPPIILKDREFVVLTRVHYDAQEKTIYVTLKSGDDALVPPTSYIRGVMHGGFLLKPIENGRKTYLVTEMHGDPKGDVPKWIVNMFQTNWAKNTISSIRLQVKKPGIIEHPGVLEVMKKGESIL